MKSIKKDNYRSNTQKIELIIPISFVGTLIISLNKFDSLITGVVIFIVTLLVGTIFYFYRSGGFQLIFGENNIIQKWEQNKSEKSFSYSDLKSIKCTSGKGGSMISLIFFQEKRTERVDIDPNCTIDELVQFVMFLKQKNRNVKTYVYPKGTTLHSRLRQEILGTEN